MPKTNQTLFSYSKQELRQEFLRRQADIEKLKQYYLEVMPQEELEKKLNANK